MDLGWVYRPTFKPLAHGALWFAIIAGIPLLMAAVARWRGRPVGATAAVLAGPLVFAIVWMHGVLCDPPNNWARLKVYGFLGFWFKPQRFYQPASLVLAGIAAVVLLAGVILARRSRAHLASLGPRAALAFACWVAAALFYRHIPDEVLDIIAHRHDRLGQLAPAVIASASALGAPLLAAALFLVGPGRRAGSS